MAKLRCKPGDIAIYNNKGDDNDGKFVRVIDPTTHPAALKWLGGPGWWTESLGTPFLTRKFEPATGKIDNTKMSRSKTCHFADRDLTPIRDNPGEDESLKWAKVNKPMITDKVVQEPARLHPCRPDADACATSCSTVLRRTRRPTGFDDMHDDIPFCNQHHGSLFHCLGKRRFASGL